MEYSTIKILQNSKKKVTMVDPWLSFSLTRVFSPESRVSRLDVSERRLQISYL